MKVVITGTSSGLGQSLWDVFERETPNLVIGSTHYREHVDEDQYYLDLRDSESIRQFADQIQRRWDKIDVLINNAGVNCIAPFMQQSPEFLRDMMQVNCFGPIQLIQDLFPALAPNGRIVNVISDASWRPMRHSLAYNCSKAAFAMATKQMARELTKPYNLGIIGVNPGKMSGTHMSKFIDEQVCTIRGWTPEQAREYAEANSVTGRELPPLMVAKLIEAIVINKVPHYASGAIMDLAG
jgi:NAD(P)-dependent dehydrogenase (short-subunit alcohol dehydrogenase family)